VSTPPSPLARARVGIVLAMLLQLAACGAEASQRRANVILVLDNTPWLEPVVRQLRDAGYTTAIAGQFAQDPTTAGFDTHCIWHSKGMPRAWGPTVLLDGLMVTYPDDVFAPELFADHLARFAADTGGKPFLAWYSLASADATSAPDTALRATAERLLRTFADTATAHRPTILLAANHGSARPSESVMSLLVACPGEANGSKRIVERRVATQDLLPTLLELASLPREGQCGDSFASDLLGRGMRPAVPR